MIEKEQQLGSQTDELDLILLEQLQQCRKNKKTIKRVRKLLKNDPVVDKGEEYIDNRITFFETMIQDKTLLHKKHKKKKCKDPDILARSIYYEWYRNVMFATNLGYRVVIDSMTQYMSYFRKGKK